MRIAHMQRVIIALVMVLGAALGATVDAKAPAAISQELRPFGDDFNGRAVWYSDEYNGVDAFPRTEHVSNAGATLEPGETAPCGATGSTLWFEWQADRSGTLTLTTEGSSIPTVMAVYAFDWTGSIVPSPPGAQLRPLACDAGTSGTDAEASISLQVQPYESYLIQVGGLNGAQGDLVIHGECECAPPNDTWSYPRYVSVDPYTPELRTSVDTTRATTEPTEDTSCGNMGATVWFMTYAPDTARLDFDVTDSNFAAAVAVYQIDYNTPADTPWGGAVRRVACGANGMLSLDLDDGYEYLVQAGGVDGARGSLVLELRCNPTCPPYNDNAGSAEWLEPPANYSANTEGATNEAGEPQACGGIDKTVWYLVFARGNTRLTIDTEFSNFRTAIAVHEVEGVSPPGGDFGLISCDAANSADDFAEIAFDVQANVGYYLQVGGIDGASGLFQLNVDCDPAPCPPFNDSIRQPLGFGPPSSEPYIIASEIQTQNASIEAGEPTGCGNMERTTWYVLDYYSDAPTLPLRITTDGSNYDTAVAIYQTSIDVFTPEFAQLTEVTCSAGGGGLRASAAFAARSNTRTWVQVGGRDGAGGSLTVAVACDPYCPPGNDNSAQAWSVSGGGFFELDTRGATVEAGEPQACGASSHTVWFRADGLGGSFELSFDASASNYQPVIAVYAVEGVSPPGGLSDAVACGTWGVEFSGAANTTYLIQVGNSGGTGGRLSATATCTGDGCVYYPDHGGQGGGGVVTAPDTGSGGYLQRAKSR